MIPIHNDTLVFNSYNSWNKIEHYSLICHFEECRFSQSFIDTVTVQASVMQNFFQLDRVMDASPPLPFYHHRQGVLAVLTSG